MVEQPHAGEGHRYSKLIAALYYGIIPDGSARLRYIAYT
jgi:hypothetical protein